MPSKAASTSDRAPSPRGARTSPVQPRGLQRPLPVRHPGYSQEQNPRNQADPAPRVPRTPGTRGTRVGWGHGMGQQHKTRKTAKKLETTQTRNAQRRWPPMPRPLPHPGATPQYPPMEGRHRRPRRPVARSSMRPTRNRRRSCCRRRRPFTFQSPGPQPPLPPDQDHQGAAEADSTHGSHAPSHARAAPMPGHTQHANVTQII